jgi:hypothetical protein
MPGDPHFQYNLAVVLARMERYAEARSVARKLQASGDPETVSVAGKFLTQLDQAEQYAAYNKMNESNSAAAAAISHEAKSNAESPTPVLRRKPQNAANLAPADDVAATAATDVPSVPAGPRAYSMVGTITDVNCVSAPQIGITLKAQSIVMHLHSGDFSQVAVKSAGTNSGTKNATCASLRGRSAHVSYQLVSEKDWDGELVSIEFRDAP